MLTNLQTTHDGHASKETVDDSRQYAF
jgi:hypothetical protein